MIKEFKEFISQGNVLDMAVGVIIGGAFSAIITALVDGLLTPLIGMIVGSEFSELAIVINNQTFAYGALIQAIINFLSISLVLFMLLKAANSVKKKPEVVEEAPVVPEDIQLLREIRDSLNK